MYNADLLAYLRRNLCMHARGIFRYPEVLFWDLCDLTGLVPITWCHGWGFREMYLGLQHMFQGFFVPGQVH
jgi:hypothetical protein